MNVAMAAPSSPAPAAGAHRVRPAPRRARVTCRAGTPADVAPLFALIDAHLAEAHLLPRRVDELTAQFRRCGQHAVVRSVAAHRRSRAAAISPRASVRG